MVEVYLFIRPKRSGKTTYLQNWISQQPIGSVAGILAPDIHGGRSVVDVSTGERRVLTADSSVPDAKIISIGRYRFNQTAFRWSQRVLRSGFERVPEWLVFDEIGYLELQGKGLEPTVRRILNWNRRIAATRLLWVVREELVADVLDYYGISSDEWERWGG